MSTNQPLPEESQIKSTHPESTGSRTATAVLPTDSEKINLHPIDAHGVRVDGGFWSERLRVNRERTLPHGASQLETAGNLHNFRMAAQGTGTYQAGSDDAGMPFPFVDTDVYRWLEAAGWELAREFDPTLSREADQVIELVSSAQRSDGYLNTYVQLMTPGQEFQSLAWGHDMYMTAHLIQAAIAWHRGLGDDRLLAIGQHAANRIDSEFPAKRPVGLDGHPAIEMALVELYRVTGESRYLELARRMIAERGHGSLGPCRFGPQYWQDHAPVRHARTVAGHAVRQMFLDCGAVDLATETADRELLEAVIRRWDDMVATRMYLTGGIGSRHRDEAFGDPLELPPDRSYAETCAAIGSVMLAWRLLLATGEAKYANIIERTAFNAVLPGVSLDGVQFFYANSLEQRHGAAEVIHGAAVSARASWFSCACCPPNLMRFLSSFEQYLATTDNEGVQIHQFAAGSIQVQQGHDMIRLVMASDYPWDGRIGITVTASPARRWTLSLRIPAWCRAATLEIDGTKQAVDPKDRYAQLAKTWEPGDRLELHLEMPVRITVPDPRIDVIRGRVAIERGPLVYCFEEVDLPNDVRLDDLALPANATFTVKQARGLPSGIRAIETPVLHRSRPHMSLWPYYDLTTDQSLYKGESEQHLIAYAVPYFTWGNRDKGAMRVWLPLHRSSSPSLD